MSESVLLFKPKTLLDELSEEMDKKDYDMVVCTKSVWTQLEGELQPLISAKYEETTIKGYDKVTADSKGSVPAEDPKAGFISISFRGRPIVAMDANDDNVIGARLQ